MTIFNLNINQGSDFSTIVTVKDSNGIPIDLTDYTSANAQIRKTYSSSASYLFTVTFDSDRTTGKLNLSVSNSITYLMSKGLYVYDILLVDSNGDKIRVFEGSVNISPMVTR